MTLDPHAAFLRAQREYDNRMPPEPDFDCECSEDHDDCDVDDCDCAGHEDGCDMCGTPHGCRCDDLYEQHKDRQMDEDRDEPDFD